MLYEKTRSLLGEEKRKHEAQPKRSWAVPHPYLGNAYREDAQGLTKSISIFVVDTFLSSLPYQSLLM